MAWDYVFQHKVPAARYNKAFPFSYKFTEVSDQKEKDYILVEAKIDKAKGKNEVVEKLNTALINVFDFNKYLSEDSTEDISEVSYYVKLVIYNVNGKDIQVLDPRYLHIHSFSSEYRFTLVKSLDQLKNILSKENLKLSFDTETTGLDHETNDIVGFSFSTERKKGYYVPVKHSPKFKDYNLGNEAIKIIHEAMTKSAITYMFNSRFDMRAVEYSKCKLSMKDVKVRDVQITTWFADPDFREHSLKGLEKHFLGVYRPDLASTLKSSKVNTFNTALISPENLLFYAAQDAISTFEIGEITDEFYDEFGMSAKIDHSLLYPLMQMENHGIRIDIAYLQAQLNYIIPRLNDIEQKIKSGIGGVNLNSPKQKADLFRDNELDTGVKTKTGAMATGTKEVEAMIERIEAQNKNARRILSLPEEDQVKYSKEQKEIKDIPEWLYYLSERTKLEKLKSTFFGSLLEQASLYKDNRVRINYRNTQAATGRMSSGAVFND